MAFTYNLASSDASEVLISRVRLELGDTTEDAGVMPDGGNLQDAEITLKLTEYSNDVTQTVGALCGILARHWATAADITVGPRRENLSQVAQAWRAQANALNPDHGAFVATVKRADGYADNASETEYA